LPAKGIFETRLKTFFNGVIKKAKIVFPICIIPSFIPPFLKASIIARTPASPVLNMSIKILKGYVRN